MTPDILKPLAVFCSHPESQRYMKNVKNLGDAWRTLAEPTTESNFTLVETKFDFTLKITNGLDQTCNSEPTIVEMSTHESPLSTTPSTESPRNYRIFADYGTDFLWRNVNDLKPGEDSYLESDEELSSFPPSVLELYDAWVDTYSDNFKKRLEETQDYRAHVFITAPEEVAWNVAGYLLAWRIAIAPQTGSVEYSVGHSKYLLERGKETSVTLQFLKDQIEILAKGEPTD